jgi:hypothetical protein
MSQKNTCHLLTIIFCHCKSKGNEKLIPTKVLHIMSHLYRMIVVHIVALLMSCSYWTVVQADYVTIYSDGSIKTGKEMLNRMKNATQKSDVIVDITPHTYSFSSLATSEPDDYFIAVEFIGSYIVTKVFEYLQTRGDLDFLSFYYTWSGYYVPPIDDGTDSNFNLFLIYNLVSYDIFWVGQEYVPSSDELFQVMLESITSDEFLPSFVSFTSGTIFDTVSEVLLEAGQLYTPGPTISASPSTQYPTPSMTQYPTPTFTFDTPYPTLFDIPFDGIPVDPFYLSFASSAEREPTDIEYSAVLSATAEYWVFSFSEYYSSQQVKTTTSTSNNTNKNNNTVTTKTITVTTASTKNHEPQLQGIYFEMFRADYDPSLYFDIRIYVDIAAFVFSGSSVDSLPTKEMLKEFMLNSINDSIYVSYLQSSLPNTPFATVTEAVWYPNVDFLEPTPFPTSSYITEHPIQRSERFPSPTRRTRKTGQKQ